MLPTRPPSDPRFVGAPRTGRHGRVAGRLGLARLDERRVRRAATPRRGRRAARGDTRCGRGGAVRGLRTAPRRLRTGGRRGTRSTRRSRLEPSAAATASPRPMARPRFAVSAPILRSTLMPVPDGSRITTRRSCTIAGSSACRWRCSAPTIAPPSSLPTRTGRLDARICATARRRSTCAATWPSC